MRGTYLTHEIEAGPEGPRIGAFFDVDGTLIAGFSVMAFWRDRLLSGRLSLGDVADTAVAAIGFRRGGRSFSALLSTMARMLRDTPEKELEETGQRLFTDEFAGLIYPESRALVKAHLRRGHTVAIASAATRYQIEPLARDLGVEHLLCSRLEVEEGVFTGRALHPYCWGPGKLEAAEHFATQNGVDIDQSYFYTDSVDDLPLLRAVGRPRPLNPDRRLRRIAQRMAWPESSFSSRGTPGLEEWVRTGLVLAAAPNLLAMGLPSAILSRKRRPLLNSTLAAWGDIGTALAGIELAVEGEEHLWSQRPAVFLFNHQSAIDVLLLCKLLRRDVVGVAKQELRGVPLLGALFEFAGTVFVDGGDRKSAIEALEPAVEVLRGGLSLVIAPEGTRAPTPRLAPFHRAAFHMAQRARVPVIPIVFRNAFDALPRHGLVIRPARIEVVVLPPIPTDGWTPGALNTEIARIRGLYEQILELD